MSNGATPRKGRRGSVSTDIRRRSSVVEEDVQMSARRASFSIEGKQQPNLSDVCKLLSSVPEFQVLSRSQLMPLALRTFVACACVFSTNHSHLVNART